MDIYILSPNAKNLFNSDLLNKLKKAGKVFITEKPTSMKNIKGLFDSSNEKILAIDPDFNNWKVDNNDLDQINNLKAVVLQTTSFSWIDGDNLAKRKIPLINLRGFSTEAVAEWAFLMALSIARKVPVFAKDNWSQDYVKHEGVELKGKTVGIIGLGRIGTRIAEICSAFGMEVIVWSKNSKDKRFKSVTLDKLISTADLIIPAVAQNSNTNGLISDKMLKSMKKTAIFVSIIHNIYNHKLVLKMAEKGDIYGYGFEEGGGKVFMKHKGNVWAGPELAWVTKESFNKNAEQWVEAIVKSSKGNFENKVN